MAFGKLGLNFNSGLLPDNLDAKANGFLNRGGCDDDFQTIK